MGKGLVAALRQRSKEIHLQLEKIGRIILNLWANNFFYRLVFTMIIRPIEQHTCSNIHLFLIYVACFSRQFWPLSGDVTKTKKGKTDKTKEMASLFTVLFEPELIIVTSRNNKTLKCHSVSVGTNCK